MCQSKANGGRRCNRSGRGTGTTTPADSASLLGNLSPDHVIDRVRSGGGFTVAPRTGAEPTNGYIINEVGACPKIPEAEFFTPEGGRAAIDAFLRDHAAWFTGSQKHIGFWHDKDNGVVVLDRVDVIEDLDAATALGRSRNQRSMWDIANQREVSFGN